MIDWKNLNNNIIKQSLTDIYQTIDSHFKQNITTCKISLSEAMEICIQENILSSINNLGIKSEIWNSGRPIRILLEKAIENNYLNDVCPNLVYNQNQYGGSLTIHDIYFVNQSKQEFLNYQNEEEISIDPEKNVSDRLELLNKFKRSFNRFCVDVNNKNYQEVTENINSIYNFINFIRNEKDELAVIKTKIKKLKIIKTDLKDYQVLLRQTYKRAYESWGEYEDKLLQRALLFSKDLSILSEIFQRSPGSLESRIEIVVVK